MHHQLSPFPQFKFLDFLYILNSILWLDALLFKAWFLYVIYQVLHFVSELNHSVQEHLTGLFCNSAWGYKRCSFSLLRTTYPHLFCMPAIIGLPLCNHIWKLHAALSEMEVIVHRLSDDSFLYWYLKALLSLRPSTTCAHTHIYISLLIYAVHKSSTSLCNAGDRR